MRSKSAAREDEATLAFARRIRGVHLLGLGAHPAGGVASMPLAPEGGAAGTDVSSKETETVLYLRHKMDLLLGRVLAGDLAVLFENAAMSIKAVMVDATFAQVQEYLKKFLFDAGMQELGIRVSENASKVRIRRDTQDTRSEFPDISKVGDLDFLAQFSTSKLPYNSRNPTVNQLKMFVALAGMVPMLVLVDRVRSMCELASDYQPQSQDGLDEHAGNLLRALKATLPMANLFASNLIDLDTVKIEMVDKDYAILAKVSADFNTDKIKALYPALENLLSHLADLEVAILDEWTKETSAPEFMNGTVPEDVDAAKCMMSVQIRHSHGQIALHVTMMVEKPRAEDPAAGRRLMWFNRATEAPVERPGGSGKLGWPVEFDETKCSAISTFRVGIKGTFRIPRLGCGSIPLPLLVCQLRYRASQDVWTHAYVSDRLGVAPAAKIDITVLHMSHNRLTSFLISPFFNLDLLRFILLNHFLIHFEVNPPRRSTSAVLPKHPNDPTFDEVDEDDGYFEFFDAKSDEGSETPEAAAGNAHYEEITLQHLTTTSATRPTSWVTSKEAPWQFNMRMNMYVPPPPRLIVSCLSLFVGEQLASPDELKMVVDLLTALAVDVKGIQARLSRFEGLEDEADVAETDLKDQTVRVMELRNIEQATFVEQRQQSKWARWVVCGGGKGVSKRKLKAD